MNNDPILGLEIDGYRVVSVIGRGGMGVVYRAENGAGEAVAVKFMAPELAQSPEFRERFMREANSGLDHDHIVPVYGTGEHNGLLYMTMYLVQGIDLKVLIRQEGKLLPARTVPIFEQAASALDEAHAAAIVHRDVKPQNILIESSADGTDHVFLSDFGLVKRVAAESSFTGSAHLVGSAQYMSPEQIQGKEIDGRADVYSLGCVAFEALTGQVPYPQEEEVAVLFAHVNDPIPSVTEHVPVLPDSVDHVIEKAMAKSPDDRYLTTGDMVAALAFELGVSGSLARSPWAADGISTSAVRRREARLKAASLRSSSAVTDPMSVRTAASSRGFLVGVAATLAVLLGFFMLSNEDRREQLGGFIGAVTGATPFAPETQPQDGAAIEKPDPTPQLRPRAKGSLPSGPPPSAMSDAKSAATTDGRESAGARTDEEPRSGDGVERPKPPSHASVLVFMSTRGEVVNQGDYGLFWMQPDGSEQSSLYNEQPQSDESEPSWSHDGSRIALASSWWIDIIDESGNGNTTITSGSNWDRYPTWSPNDGRLAFMRHPQQGGRIATGAWELYSIEVDGSGLRRLTNNNVADRYPDWSSAGIAFSRDRGGFTRHDIMVMDPRTGEVRSIISTPVDDLYPEWSPDEKRIAFTRYERSTGESDIWVGTIATGRVERITEVSNAYRPSWSPDGKWIAFDAGGDVWKVRVRDGKVVRLTTVAGTDSTVDWR